MCVCVHVCVCVCVCVYKYIYFLMDLWTLGNKPVNSGLSLLWEALFHGDLHMM